MFRYKYFAGGWDSLRRGQHGNEQNRRKKKGKGQNGKGKYILNNKDGHMG